MASINTNNQLSTFIGPDNLKLKALVSAFLQHLLQVALEQYSD